MLLLLLLVASLTACALAQSSPITQAGVGCGAPPVFGAPLLRLITILA